MDTKEVTLVQTVTSQKKKQPPKGGNLSVQTALRAMRTKLKAERVQFAVMLSDQEVLLMLHGRPRAGNLGDLTDAVVKVAAALH